MDRGAKRATVCGVTKGQNDLALNNDDNKSLQNGGGLYRQKLKLHKLFVKD